MPHFTLEYTANLRATANVPSLLKKVNNALIAQDGAYPIGGIRSRAIELVDYCMADGEADYSFVHATLKIGSGRSEEVKQKTCREVFEVIKMHFASIYAQRYLALSMEFHEFDEGGTYKQNNVHARFK